MATRKEDLALYGGPKAKRTPYGTGQRFGEAELKHLREALEQNTLFYLRGQKTQEFCRRFAEMHGVKHCVGTSSGTASIHVALCAIGVSLGDEVITGPITDAGSVIGILYQNALPVFADLLPHTYNLDPRSVAERITERTRAILVVHLAGNPTDMDPILELAEQHGIYVLEDCAQAYRARYKGRWVGTMGAIGCFSLNDFKHISAGDAGMVITDNDELGQMCRLCADKGYRRDASGLGTEFLAPNYRMNELEAACALGQLPRLDWICQRRRELGDRLTDGIRGLPGIYPHEVTEGGECTYWFYMLSVTAEELGHDRDWSAQALQAEGISASAGYIPKVVYQWAMFQNRSAYARTHFPFDYPAYGGNVTYEPGLCPVAEGILATAIRLPINEFYTDEDIEQTIEAIRKVAGYRE